MKLVSVFSSSLLAIVFVASAVLKLEPIAPFEAIIVQNTFLGWKMAPFFARIIIGIELAIAGLLLLRIWLPFVRKATIVFLLGMSAFLCIQILQGEGAENCMCFGSNFSLNAYESLLKNAIMLCVAFFIVSESLVFKPKVQLVIGCVLIPGLIALAFILNPVNIASAINSIEGEGRYEEILTDLSGDNENKLYVIYSLTCPHCKLSAQKLKVLEGDLPELNVQVLFFGDSALVDLFQIETNTDFKYQMFNQREIMELTDGRFPSAILMQNDTLTYRFLGAAFNDDAFTKIQNSVEEE